MNFERDIWLIILLFLMGALLIYLYFQIRRLKSKIQNLDHKSESSKLSQYSCLLHEEKVAAGVCNICEKNFCHECIVEQDGLSFCRNHLFLYQKSDWIRLRMVRTTPDEPHEALHLYEAKKKLWEKDQEPIIVRTHYNINVENDFIESFVELLCLNDRRDVLNGKLK